MTDIVAQKELEPEFLNTLPENLRQFLKNYGPIFYLYDPFIDWLREQKVPEEDLREIHFFLDYQIKNAWPDLTTDTASIWSLKSSPTKLDNTNDFTQKLKDLGMLITSSARAYPESKDKDGKQKYDPDTIQHSCIIIIKNDKLPQLEASADCFPEQRRIFPPPN